MRIREIEVHGLFLTTSLNEVGFEDEGTPGLTILPLKQNTKIIVVYLHML